MDDDTSFVLESTIETYALGFNLLADLIREFLDVSKDLMMQIVLMLAFPIYFLAIILFTIVLTLLGVAPRQDFLLPRSTPTHASVELDSLRKERSNSSDSKAIRHADRSRLKTSDGRAPGAFVGHSRINTPRPPSASPNYLSLSHAIPPHLQDCEFYYNNVDIDIVENSPMLKSSERPLARITVDGESHTHNTVSAKRFLENLETERRMTVNNAGIFDLGEEKRGKMELKNRVYVGPALWLLRVLMEEM